MLSVDWDFFPFQRLEAGEREIEALVRGLKCKICTAMLYDWGHNEGHGHAIGSVLWDSRYAAFAHAGIDGEQEVAIRFDKPCVSIPRFAQDVEQRLPRMCDAPMWYSDSHAHGLTAAEAAFVAAGRRPLTVINFDAHHDLAYTADQAGEVEQDGAADCGSWLFACLVAGLAERVHIVYPDWRDTSDEVAFDKKKSPWLKPWRRRIKKWKWSDWCADTPTYGTSKYGNVVMTHLCRSSSWTPPWLDGHSSEALGLIAASTRHCLDCDSRYPHIGGYNACKPRPWSSEGARAMAEQMRVALAEQKT